MKKKCILILITFILLIIIGVIIFKVFNNEPKFEVKFKTRIKDIEKDFKSKDIIGWIQVQGTNIDYPITEEKRILGLTSTEDLEHLWLSNQYIDGFNRKAFYGHNIRNVSSNPIIVDPTHKGFEQLLSFTDYNFAKNNLYIQYTHDGKDEIYKIYAVSFQYNAIENGYSYYGADVENYIEKAKKDSIYDYDIDVNEKDEIIALITCTRYYGTGSKNQYRVDARKIRENENITKYKVEKNKNYDIIREDREN